MNNWLNWLTEKNETSQFSRSAWFCRTMGWLHWLQDDSRFMAEFQMWISGIAKTKQRHWSILRLFSFFSFLASLSSGFLVLRTALVRRPLRQEAEFCKIWLSEFEALADPMKFLGRSVVISVSDGIKKASTIWSFLKWGVPPNQKKNHRMFHQKKHLFWGAPIGSLCFNGPQSYWNCLDLDPDPGRCGRFRGTTRMEWWDHDPGGHRLQLQDLTRFWDHFAGKLPELKPYIPKKGWLTDLYLVKGHNCIALEKHVSSSGNFVS